MGNGGKRVSANPDRLPLGWQRDRDYAAEIRRQIKALIRQGYSQSETALRVGCSQRTVERTLHWTPPVTHRCGRPLYKTVTTLAGQRVKVRRTGSAERCASHVAKAGQPCSKHR